ncbi:hypothetical protein [Pseudorhodobacter sp.]|uniref:hypothetical protein n=1 Tax=Pseudorhodobacter sp. TaxID=1934400 RepID=UPI0026476EBE|nr:hypothetical protein [Pseudorhodobacter sp.]MDN5788269.1 hypothetical protein [Pseudorhodobacter sp.]
MAATYPDAPDGPIAQWQQRRKPLGAADCAALAPLDSDLKALLTEPVAPPAPSDRYISKIHELQGEFVGQSALLLQHGLAVAHLRKREYPAHTPALFRRFWQEQSPHLLAALSTRWLISALITFGEHGGTEAERSLAREMGMLFSVMKLYEFERLHSGKAPEEPFGLKRVQAELPLGMTPFSLATGGLDINLLAPLWLAAEVDTTSAPLGRELLRRLNDDPGGLFRRIAAMRARKRARIAGKKE